MRDSQGNKIYPGEQRFDRLEKYVERLGKAVVWSGVVPLFIDDDLNIGEDNKDDNKNR